MWNKDNRIRIVIMAVMLVGAVVFLAYSLARFAKEGKELYEAKKQLDSLQKVELRLEIELKEHKIQELKESNK